MASRSSIPTDAHRIWNRAYIQAAGRALHEAEAAAAAAERPAVRRNRKSVAFDRVNTKSTRDLEGFHAARPPADPPSDMELTGTVGVWPEASDLRQCDGPIGQNPFEVASSRAFRFVPAILDKW